MSIRSPGRRFIEHKTEDQKSPPLQPPKSVFRYPFERGDPRNALCEALDLVLGPDRLSRFPPVEEFDFYDGKYLQPPTEEGGDPTPIPFRIEVVLTDLSAEVQKRCATHLELWHLLQKRLLDQAEVLAATPGTAVPCLRLETVGPESHAIARQP